MTMDYGKYVIVKYSGIETAILFPSFLNHSDMTMGHEAVSAGLFQVSINDITKDIYVGCFGESTTLKLKARIEDIFILKRLLKGKID